MQRVEQLISHFKLEQHPEGGFYREVYKASLEVAAPWGRRPAATNIYFLLTASSFSAFHRIKADEGWHYFEGDPILIHSISPSGTYQSTELGPNSADGSMPRYQAMVPGGSWFASECKGPVGYTLVGCTVAPGFHFADFELADGSKLIQQFPTHETLIRRLTRWS